MVKKHESRPVRGAWIETLGILVWFAYMFRRAPYGARGLKQQLLELKNVCHIVAPRTGRVD